MDLLNYCWFGFKRFFGKIGIDIDEVEHYCIWDKPGQGHKQDTRIEEALVWLHAPALQLNGETQIARDASLL